MPVNPAVYFPKVPKRTTVLVVISPSTSVLLVKAVAVRGPSFEFAVGYQPTLPTGQNVIIITERLLRDDAIMDTGFFLNDRCSLVFTNNSNRDYIGFLSAEWV